MDGNNKKKNNKKYFVKPLKKKNIQYFHNFFSREVIVIFLEVVHRAEQVFRFFPDV